MKLFGTQMSSLQNNSDLFRKTITMEKAKILDLQIFNIIEEIEDGIDESQRLAEIKRSSTSNHALS